MRDACAVLYCKCLQYNDDVFAAAGRSRRCVDQRWRSSCRSRHWNERMGEWNAALNVFHSIRFDSIPLYSIPYLHAMQIATCSVLYYTVYSIIELVWHSTRSLDSFECCSAHRIASLPRSGPQHSSGARIVRYAQYPSVSRASRPPYSTVL